MQIPRSLAALTPQLPTIPDRQFIPDKTAGKMAIQQALDQAKLAGGGRVVVPAGHWPTRGLRLTSGIELHLKADAVLDFSTDPTDYLPAVLTRWEGTECSNYQPLIYAADAHDLSITGKGTVNGHGEAWWPWRKRQHSAALALSHAQAENIPVAKRIYATPEAALRPSFIQPFNCHAVLISGITVINGPQWTLHPVYCDQVTIKDVTVITHGGPNTDGCNPDSSRNVLIQGCHFNTGDDCIALNSGLNEDGWRVARPCENVVIADCTMVGGHGAIALGSAMSGGIRDVYIHDCQMHDTMQGLRIKSMKGRGGKIARVWADHLTIDHCSNEAIQINMYYEFTTVPPLSDTPPVFDDLLIQNVHGHDNHIGLLIRGIPEHPINAVTLSHIALNAELAADISAVKHLDLTDIQLGGKLC